MTNTYIKNDNFFRNDAQFTFDHDKVGTWTSNSVYLVGDAVKHVIDETGNELTIFYECIAENGSITGGDEIEPGVDADWTTYWKKLSDNMETIGDFSIKNDYNFEFFQELASNLTIHKLVDILEFWADTTDELSLQFDIVSTIISDDNKYQSNQLSYRLKDNSTVVIDISPNEDVGNWTTSGDLNTARYGLAGAGTQNAALSFGGFSVSAVTEKFDGTSWSNTANLINGRDEIAGVGLQNSALSFGGGVSFAALAYTEKFNGTSWLSANPLNTARFALAGVGIQNSALSFSGENNVSAKVATTEKFNGTSWSNTGDMTLARDSLAGAGTQNATLASGGSTGTVSTVTEKFNGTLWSQSNDLNTARDSLAGAGMQNSAISFGGNSTGSLSVTEKFDGVTWSNVSNLNTARFALAGVGTQNTALSFGGFIVSSSAVTEKYNISLPSLSSDIYEIVIN